MVQRIVSSISDEAACIQAVMAHRASARPIRSDKIAGSCHKRANLIDRKSTSCPDSEIRWISESEWTLENSII